MGRNCRSPGVVEVQAGGLADVGEMHHDATSASSSGVAGLPATAVNNAKPLEFAGMPFASGVPNVSDVDRSTGGAQDGSSSGGPWRRFGAVHGEYAGTSDTRSGDAARGRG